MYAARCRGSCGGTDLFREHLDTADRAAGGGALLRAVRMAGSEFVSGSSSGDGGTPVRREGALSGAGSIQGPSGSVNLRRRCADRDRRRGGRACSEASWCSWWC
jgi:hypothetical protein